MARQEQEPVWRGKRYSEWLEGHTASSSAKPPYGSAGWLEAEEAVKQIGTNGIPVLLRMLAARDDGLKERLTRLAAKQRLIRVPYRYAFHLNEEALHAFEVLGPSASNAVPLLVDLYARADSVRSRRCVALALSSIGRPAQKALPVLITDFGHTNGEIRFYAVSAVGNIGGDPEVVVPALTSVLGDPKKEVRWNAIVGLSSFGRRAHRATPVLVDAWKTESEAGNEDLVQQLETALWRIAPEKTPKVLVVQEVSEWVQGGVTTHSIDMQIGKERRTLIPAGARIPYSMQCWTSDPRGPIRLYGRGVISSEVEKFVGEFEIVGLPEEPGEVHAYAVVGIADGNLFLCARDVNQRRLLEVRRVR